MTQDNSALYADVRAFWTTDADRMARAAIRAAVALRKRGATVKTIATGSGVGESKVEALILAHELLESGAVARDVTGLAALVKALPQASRPMVRAWRGMDPIKGAAAINEFRRLKAAGKTPATGGKRETTPPVLGDDDVAAIIEAIKITADTKSVAVRDVMKAVHAALGRKS